MSRVQPKAGRNFDNRRRRGFRAGVERMESRRLLATFRVINTDDSGAGSLRQAILDANANAGADQIVFDIPASTAPRRDVPVPGFDPITQTWRIAPTTALPTITDQVTIDGYTQAHSPVAYRYPNAVGQSLELTGSPTGGTFTLTTQAPLPVRTTDPIPYDANTAQVLAALVGILGAGNVTVSGGPELPGNTMTIQFSGDYASLSVPPLLATSSLTGGGSPGVSVSKVATGDPVQILSQSNTVTATEGNRAKPRVILDGSLTGGATGLTIDASHTQVRGFIIDGFGVGVSIPSPDNVGNLVQGNFIGQYILYPVDGASGDPLPAPDGVIFTGTGNSLQGVLLGSTNATIGGADTQANNVIVGNGQQGVWILPGAEGNQVIGNQIGIVGPVETGRFVIAPNGAEGVLVEASSNFVGGVTAGSGNLISANVGDGVRIVGAQATRNVVEGNYIGIGPGGGFRYGAEGTGNGGDGVRIEDASNNRVGGSGDAQQNVISANDGAGVRILGTSTANAVLGNIIGLTSDGLAPRGNAGEGVWIGSPSNVVGPGNIISANLRGVLVTGPQASGNSIFGNLIGTNVDGAGDIGNAREGVRIDGAPNNTIYGDGNGSQVISGNNVGVLLIGGGATGNAVRGNLIGTDNTGLLDRSNSLEGVRIDGAPGNVIGGTTQAERNLISANHWGVVITGAGATGNTLQGNLIGTDLTGQAPLGNEVDGVVIEQGASGNLTGGSSTAAGNTIAYNVRDGVRVVDGNSVRNAILTNSIFRNGALGIDLVAPGDPPSGVTPNDPGDGDTGPNDLQNAPVLTAIASSVAYTNIRGTLQSTPNSSFTVQFFANATLDPSGSGEGERYLGQATVQTNASGLATFSVDVPATVPAGQYVTSTATDASGNTSEFSPGLAEVLGTTQFVMSAFTVNEAAGTATISVTRLGGSGGLFTVNYATSDGTATAGKDYEPASGTLTFDPGVDTQTFTVTILNDTLPEADETVNLTLSNPAGAATLGTPSTAVLTILDDDQPGAIAFAMADYTVDETAGTATITVVRDSGGGTVSVAYATSDGTATAGVNYAATSGVLTFGVGQQSATFTVPIIYVPALTGEQTVILTLSNPTGGATLGDPSSAVLTINDDTADRVGPKVIGLTGIPGRAGTAGVVIRFDEPLDPARAANLLNYGYAIRSAGRDGRLGTFDDRLIGVRAAIYDPATMSVRLVAGQVIHRDLILGVVINETTGFPGSTVGVSDTSGNLLDGNFDNTAGGTFAGTVVARPQPRRVPVVPAARSPWQNRPTHAFRALARPRARLARG